MSTFYAGQRVVVTGGAGMIGSALVTQLVALGADVLVQDDFSRGQHYVTGAQYIRTDAGNEQACKTALKGAFALFNLAAYVAGVEYNQHNHGLMFERNVRLQTMPILIAAAVGVPHVLQTSSVCVYSPHHNHPATEAHGHDGEPHPANNGYAWAKRTGERVVGWAGLAHAVIVRPSNVYGPRDYFDSRAHVIPALIEKALTERVLRVNGSGLERREFIYVDDVASGMLAALERGDHGEVYNVGTHGDTCVSIRQLVDLIQDATDTADREVAYSQEFSSGDPDRWSDTSAMHALGWWHMTGLEQGIRQTVDWYRRKR
jgi:nucleoside-diphosphate-sugar epimerase